MTTKRPVTSRVVITVRDPVNNESRSVTVYRTDLRRMWAAIDGLFPKDNPPQTTMAGPALAILRK